MNYAEFVRQLEWLNDGDVYVSPDFQCDRTGGYPTSLCVNWDKCKAWLQLARTLCKALRFPGMRKISVSIYKITTEQDEE